MRHSRSIITVVIIIAIAVFVVAAVSSFISGTSDHYDRPSSPAEVLEKMTEAVESTDDETTQVEETTETSEEVTQAAQQEAQALESSTEEEVLNNTNEAVESAIEEAKETSKSVSDRANEAIAAAENSAAEGRADAEARLQEVEKEAGITEEPAEVADPATVESKNHTVTAQGLIYEPLVVTIAPGDSVSWTNMSTHNTESIEGLIPEGAEMWTSKMSENYSRTFTQEGIYVYKCTPHFGAGMGGAVIVGEPVNLEQIKNSGAKGAAKRLVNKAIQAAEAM
jgi:pseudoazurin